MKSQQRHELFANEYFEIAADMQSNHLREQLSVYAPTKLKFRKTFGYFKYKLLLSGDISLHPGPVRTHALFVERQLEVERYHMAIAAYRLKSCMPNSGSSQNEPCLTRVSGEHLESAPLFKLHMITFLRTLTKY